MSKDIKSRTKDAAWEDLVKAEPKGIVDTEGFEAFVDKVLFDCKNLHGRAPSKQDVAYHLKSRGLLDISGEGQPDGEIIAVRPGWKTAVVRFCSYYNTYADNGAALHSGN